MSKQMMAYNGHGGEIGMLTEAEAIERYGRRHVVRDAETDTLSVMMDRECECCVPSGDQRPTLVQAIEDNGGNLYLVIHHGDTVAHLYSTDRPDAWGATMREVVEAAGQPDGAGAWDGDADDPQAEYDKLTSHKFGWKVVADWTPGEGYDEYADSMGAAARAWAGAVYALVEAELESIYAAINRLDATDDEKATLRFADWGEFEDEIAENVDLVALARLTVLREEDAENEYQIRHAEQVRQSTERVESGAVRS